MKKFRKIAVSILLILAFSAVQAKISDAELLRQKVKDEVMNPTVNEASAKELMATIRPDGTLAGHRL